MKPLIFFVLVAFCLPILLSAEPAQASNVKISERVCRQIAKHAPADGGAYQAGVDVRGKKVVGADAGTASPIKAPESISFDYGIDLDKKYGIGSTGTASAIATIGKVTVRGNRVYWNGQPLDDGDLSAMAAHCARVYGKN